MTIRTSPLAGLAFILSLAACVDDPELDVEVPLDDEAGIDPEAAARSTGCVFESPGRDLTLRACDASGGRTINYAWTNRTGARKCVAAYWWNQGVRNQIDPKPGTAWVVEAGETLWFHDARAYTVFADATIEVNTCNTSVFTFRYRIGALGNPNGFI